MGERLDGQPLQPDVRLIARSRPKLDVQVFERRR